MFVIVNKKNMGLGKYYLSKYIVQGEYYLSFTDDTEKAKKYTTLNRARRALESLNNYTYRYVLDVEEVK